MTAEQAITIADACADMQDAIDAIADYARTYRRRPSEDTRMDLCMAGSMMTDAAEALGKAVEAATATTSQES